MIYSYDTMGWVSETPINGRTTEFAPPAHTTPVVGQVYPNFTGNGWALVPYALPPVPAVPVRIFDAFVFYRKFTSAERIAAKTLALTDMNAADFMHTLDNAIAAKANVRSDDPDTIAGLAYLSAMPVANPVLAAGRSAALLA